MHVLLIIILFIIDCDGQAYIFSGDLSIKLYNQSLKTNFFVFEDVFVGMLAKNLFCNFESSFESFYAFIENNNAVNESQSLLYHSYIIYVNSFIDSFFLFNQLLKIIFFL